MKYFYPIAMLFCLLSGNLLAQTQLQSYFDFREANKDIDYQGLHQHYARPSQQYYKGYNLTPNLDKVLYLDTASSVFSLTQAEKTRLSENHFFVSERLTKNSFTTAFHEVYAKDLPVFVSTDAILHALHNTYSTLLKTIEREQLSTNLLELVKTMYNEFPAMAANYSNYNMDKSLADIDLYLTVVYSLMLDRRVSTRMASTEAFNEIMDAIDDETLANIPLFCDPPQLKSIDFSQFKVRGHYVYTDNDKENSFKSLEPYFRTMMWIGRIDFFLSPPANTPWTKPWNREEIRRMNIDAFLLNQLLQQSAAKTLYNENEKLINYFVGISDNTTPLQYNEYIESKQLTSAVQLLDDLVFDDYLLGLVSNDVFKQRIMGEALFSNPDATEPDILPISFKLSGQRFIIDSEILSNVVYDRIILKEKKVKRMMPKTLDVLFALGNNDAAFFLHDEIEQYYYAPNLANMRFLIDNKDEAFWNASLYNTWLGAIRNLNPIANNEKLPFFMQTSAWHQQKMNTQLGSWTQLRHDNLLYAKPSYTGMTGCSYPYSYIEPYPAFYQQLAVFSENVAEFLSQFNGLSWEYTMIPSFFKNFAETMNKLSELATKEINNQPFTSAEEDWLNRMLFEDGESGRPPYSGWYGELFLNGDEMTKPDLITVDIHTQPTDEYGNILGKVLHTGTGYVNLGVFIIPQPGNKKQYIAYTGPFYSYYEKITDDFDRMTDQEWKAMVNEHKIPARPNWTKSYLLNSEGESYTEEKSLPSVYLIGKVNVDEQNEAKIFNVFPIPTSNYLNIETALSNNKSAHYTINDISGRLFLKGIIYAQQSVLDVSSLKKGCYLLRIESEEGNQVFRILKE